MNQQKIPVTEIQRFSTHDGPGIRTVVFLPGCPLRCAWCHNPEAKTARNQIYYIANFCIGCGACAAVCHSHAHIMENQVHRFQRNHCDMCGKCTILCPSGALEDSIKYFTADEIMDKVARDRPFYDREGGITLSGGEPLSHGCTSMELLQKAKALGIHTAVQTCGFAPQEIVAAAAGYTDLFLWDIKDTNPERHEQYTGVRPELILDNLRMADCLGTETVLRCILVKGVNTDARHYQHIADIYHSLQHCRGVQLLPYHTYGSSKSVQLGEADPARPAWIPEEADLAYAVNEFTKNHINLLST